MADAGFWAVFIVFGVLAIAAFGIILVATRYKRCASDEILVVYGRIRGGKASRCIHGGAVMVWPLIQEYKKISLIPMTISIPLDNALSLQNIRINVPSTFTVGVSTNPLIMNNAAERLLHLTKNDIEGMAQEIILGQLRLTVASLTIEQINQDRDAFLELIRDNVGAELHKLGLYLINVNIIDITDESNYINSIGKKAAAGAVNKALVDVANAERDGAIGKANADREREVQVAQNVAESEKGQKAAEVDRRVYVQQQEATGVQGENISRAEIAAYQADLEEKEAEAMRRAEVARRTAEMEVQKAQYNLEQERLRAEEIVREEISKTQVEIAAEAEAERQRRIAQGEADAVLARYNAEAEGTKAVLEAKANGYKQLVASAGGDVKAAATLLMVEKIEEIVARQTEAIANLQIDKITVWDSGNGGEGGSTANFVSSLIRSLPPVHDVAKMAGVDLPDYLGSMKEE
ncbi:MAG TPA: flotillin family protein [Candidatus Poseidoniaceae archaeon]|nr:flotillin [Euryarchaeota archaeon]DAC55585.1 MAG TPA: flotillin family protein [Candidatus Poseidoniales archaeon]HII30568.1 flotillin family protein [Candidatus Poseidoniaceae archaeon]|tara:strand:- start:4236 stop:5624 length:1389 start_codon:yes stop_codon:yes gene_type:complete